MRGALLRAFRRGTALLLCGAAILSLAACGNGKTTETEIPETEETMETTRQQEFDDASFRGIVFRAPKGVTVILYAGFAGDKVIKADHTEDRGGERYRYYSSIEPGQYHYTASGAGRYHASVALFVSPEKLAARTEIDADPGVKAGKGWEADKVQATTEEMRRAALALDPGVRAEFAPVLTTPSFTNEKAAHEFTSQKELTGYLASLDDPSKHARQYVLTTSGAKGYDLPIVVFTKTDLSGCATWREAAEKVKANGKPTVHYQAQIHGNEPAGGEGALVMIGELYRNDAWREALLDSINIYIIPRVNPDGAEVFTRNEVKFNANMNRDLYSAKTKEVQGVLSAIHAFGACVLIDGHEYTVNNQTASGVYNDILMRMAGSLNTSGGVRLLSESIMEGCFGRLWEKGLRASGYPDVDGKGGGSTMNEDNPIMGTAYMGADGSLAFLVETRGIGDGRFSWERRVVAQFVAIRGIIEQTAERAGEIQSAVLAERARLAANGKTYDPDDRFVLECSLSKKKESAFYWTKPVYDYATGKMTSEGKNSPIYYFDTAVRSRPRATAYVLPKGEAWEAELKRFLEIHDVRYYEIAPGASARLCGYTGTTQKAELTEEAAVSFPNGAVVIPLDQSGANIAAYLIEPDVTDVREGSTSLAQMGAVSPVDGVFPIYRYQGDLRANGTVPTF